MRYELAKNEILDGIRFFNCQLLVKTDIVFESKNIFIERAGPVGPSIFDITIFFSPRGSRGTKRRILIEIFLQLSSGGGVSRYKILHYLPVGKRHPFGSRVRVSSQLKFVAKDRGVCNKVPS